MSTSPAAHSIATLPAGSWEIDPSASSLVFKSRGMWGLAAVTGKFGSYEGTLTVEETGASGELKIDAASLDTGNEKRDTHLRSADFFDVDNAPTISFTLTSVSPGTHGALTAGGVLRIRDTSLDITAPLTITELAQDRVRLEMNLAVDRDAAGVGWSKMGMIRGQAQLETSVELVRRGAH